MLTLIGGGSRFSASGGGTSDLEQDWLDRSSAAGVFFAERFNTSGTVSGYPQNDTEVNVVWEETIKRSGDGALRINVLKTLGADTGSQRLALGQLRGNGSTTYYQFTVYTTDEWLRHVPTYTGSRGGPKLGMVSGTNSNTNNECVWQNKEHRGFPFMYYQDGDSFENFSEVRSTPCNGTNYSFSNAIDAGTPTTISTCSDYERRYGVLYQNPALTGSGVPPAGADAWANGYPSTYALESGLPRFVQNGWTTITTRITIGTLGTASSTVEMWAGPPGGSRVKILSFANVTLGTENSGHTHIWLTPYDSHRDANSVPYDTFIVYAEVIASTADIPHPAVA